MLSGNIFFFFTSVQYFSAAESKGILKLKLESKEDLSAAPPVVPGVCE